MEDARYCSNCRAELPEDVDSCPECGVYAGDLFDERSLRPRTRRGFWWALIAAIVEAVASGGHARCQHPAIRTDTLFQR